MSTKKTTDNGTGLSEDQVTDIVKKKRKRPKKSRKKKRRQTSKRRDQIVFSSRSLRP